MTLPMAHQRPSPRLRRDRALETMRADIVAGRLAPGQRLTERELCSHLDVSRTIAREIVRDLHVERLIEVEPHCGVRVARLTPRTLAEIYDIREELEVLVARAFIAAADESHLAVLRARFAHLQTLAHADDLAGIARETTGFSRYMIAVSGHGVAGQILGGLHARIDRLRLLSMSRPGRITESLSEFADLVDAICAGDVPAAERTVRVNLRGARAAALAQLAQISPETDTEAETEAALDTEPQTD